MAVYLKNRISRGWPSPDDSPIQNVKSIPEEEKPNIRNRLVPILANAPPPIRAQLIPTLYKILSHDFPAKWPEFLDITLQLLNGNDANSVFAGVQCMLSICKVYRFKAGDSKHEFDKVVALSFPLLLNIGNRLVGEDSIEAGEMLRAVLKTYKHAIYVSAGKSSTCETDAKWPQYDLPSQLRDHQVMVGWCTLFLTVVSKDPPPCALTDDVDERESNHWWKAKKWAYANLNRLFVRYVFRTGQRAYSDLKQLREPLKYHKIQRRRVRRVR